MKSQRGAALLTAMLTVALVATFASASLWQQWRSIEVETSERARVQSEWILNGALDWSRLLLSEDKRGVDYLGEPWAVPLQEARMSSFLAADRNNSASSESEVLDAFLSGQIVDLQSRLNVNNMVDTNGGVVADEVKKFARLFTLLGLPVTELDRLSENLRFAVASARTTPASPQAPLRPQRVAQLAWLGLSPQTVAALEPYVTLLPAHTLINVNTASAEVITAAGNMDLAEAQRLVQARASAHFTQIGDAQRLLGDAAKLTQADAGVATDFFEVRARLRLDRLVVEERTVVWRSGRDILVLQRERVPPDPAALPQATTSQR
jgi:general secretion pathway protein K